jgi:hypothetical protein
MLLFISCFLLVESSIMIKPQASTTGSYGSNQAVNEVHRTRNAAATRPRCRVLSEQNKYSNG